MLLSVPIYTIYIYICSCILIFTFLNCTVYLVNSILLYSLGNYMACCLFEIEHVYNFKERLQYFILCVVRDHILTEILCLLFNTSNLNSSS